MSNNEAIYVAIAIACVVAILLVTIFIVYCVKRQQNKELDRQMRERRLREERHRRHLMRAHIVRPPPYDPNRQNVLPFNRELPFSPPPEYKEVATPVPGQRRTTGIGNMDQGPTTYGYNPSSQQIPTISRNVAPANTFYTGGNHSYPNGSVYVGNNYMNSSNRNDGNYISNTNTHNNINNNNNNNNNNNRNRNNEMNYINRSHDPPARHHSTNSTEEIIPPRDPPFYSARETNAARVSSPTLRRNVIEVAPVHQARSNNRRESNVTINSTNHNQDRRESAGWTDHGENRRQAYNQPTNGAVDANRRVSTISTTSQDGFYSERGASHSYRRRSSVDSAVPTRVVSHSYDTSYGQSAANTYGMRGNSLRGGTNRQISLVEDLSLI